MTGRESIIDIQHAIRDDPTIVDYDRFVRLRTGRVECVLCGRSGTSLSHAGLPDFSQPYWWRSWAPWQYGCIVAHTYRCSCGRSFPAFNNLWRHIGGPRPAGWGRHDGIEHRPLDFPERTSA